MMQELRTIITIDEEKCDGCGLCVAACHEGAIALVDGKANLMHEHYCDGLGDCLPACPTGAITFEERIAQAYDEQAVLAAQRQQASATLAPAPAPEHSIAAAHGCPSSAAAQLDSTSELRQWPVQIKLVAPSAPYFQGADILIAADCAAFAYASFHRDFMAGKVTLIGCPKLDMVDYAEKLTQIVAANDISSITVARMSVPCCGGIERAAKEAVAASGKNIPVVVSTIATDGTLQY
ncbi:MAG: 4Fe-4S binding protein [Raoultibacter sp.]